MSVGPARKRITKLRETLEWMKANPRFTIDGGPAENYAYKTVFPLAKDARYFCFVGRYVRDHMDERFDYCMMEGWLEYDFRPIGGKPTMVNLLHINDEHLDPAERFMALEEYIDELETIYVTEAN